MSQADQVRIIGAIIGRSIRFEELSPEDFRRETAGSWPARTFRQWAADHADAFRNAQRVTDTSQAG